MYSRIVVPVDGSKFAEAALPLALTLTRKTGASLHLVSVVEPIPDRAYLTLDYEDWESAAQEGSREYLRTLTDRVAEHVGGEVTTALLTGHVVEALQAEVVDQNADVVIMATHGRGALSQVWLGSVAHGFLHGTDRPLILVRPQEGEPPSVDAEHSFETLLVPLDGSELAESALAHATDFGELFESAYHLARVVAYPVGLASPYLADTALMNQTFVEDAKQSAGEYLESLAERMRRRGLRVTTSVTVDAQAGHGILKEAETLDRDCIAMATHGRTGIGRALLGSTADKVLRGTDLPLLLYRPAESRA